MLNKTTKLQSIAILTCYFGKWPWYFPYFLQSCKYNPTIDFIIITGNSEPIEDKPSNVIIIQKTLNDIKIAASKKLGFNVTINDPYKLCDFKPAYGFIMTELIAEYKFWGHADIDVIYGDIRSFITEDLMNEYELITAHHKFLSGTFTLFKNNKKMNMLFMESKDYKKVFSTSTHFCFDECNFLWKQICELGKMQTIFDIPYTIESMTHIVRRLQLEDKLIAFFDFMIVEGIPGHIKWIEGKVIFKNRLEALLYHLIVFKKKNKPSKVYNPMPKSYNISSKRIYSR